MWFVFIFVNNIWLILVIYWVNTPKLSRGDSVSPINKIPSLFYDDDTKDNIGHHIGRGTTTIIPVNICKQNNNCWCTTMCQLIYWFSEINTCEII
jgi:hypothetical protein